METIKYMFCDSRTATRGNVGVCRVKQENHFAMVIESSSSGRNALLILSEGGIRITETNLGILIIPSAYIRPVISRDTVIFNEVAPHLGAIRFIDGKSKLLASDGDWIKFVDINTGDTEGFHSHEAPMTTRWELIAPSQDGALEVLLCYTSTTIIP